MAWLVGFLIWIVPVWLGREPAEPRPPAPQEPRAPGPRADQADVPFQQKFHASHEGDLDRPAFLAAFSRQAGRELMPCLREAIGPRGSIALTARLNRRGELSSVNFLSPPNGAASLECARTAIERMSFTGVAARMPGETLEIEWRFDW